MPGPASSIRRFDATQNYFGSVDVHKLLSHILECGSCIRSSQYVLISLSFQAGAKNFLLESGMVAAHCAMLVNASNLTKE